MLTDSWGCGWLAMAPLAPGMVDAAGQVSHNWEQMEALQAQIAGGLNLSAPCFP